MPAPGEKIDSLDGFRAVSILLVVFGHADKSWGMPAWLSVSLEFLVHQQAGVMIFFVISGFLITNLLLDEKRATGDVNIQRFYGRRLLRILPVNYLYIGFVFCLWTSDPHAFSGSAFLHALTYTFNFAANDSWLLGHLWSLSIEEQFYLLWPNVIFFPVQIRS